MLPLTLPVFPKGLFLGPVSLVPLWYGIVGSCSNVTLFSRGKLARLLEFLSLNLDFLLLNESNGCGLYKFSLGFGMEVGLLLSS